MTCKGCPLFDPDHTQVPGRGSPNATVAWVGDHPDSDAEKLERAFPVDKSKPFSAGCLTEGALRSMASLGFERIWVSYALRCNPHHQKAVAGAKPGSLPPKAKKVSLKYNKHIAPCRRINLDNELAALKNLQVVVAAGEQAVKSLLGPEHSVAASRGRWWPKNIGGREVLVRVTFSASTINRLCGWVLDNVDARRPQRVKREYWVGSVPWLFGQDMKAIAALVKERGLHERE